MPPKRATRLRSNKFDANITKKGLVSAAKEDKTSSRSTMGPITLGIMLFVVVGSLVFGIISQMGNKL